MNTTLYYLFDPLCGWCYGATSTLTALIDAPGVMVKLMPTGLFSGDGTRSMDANFASYAWSNDQRIARLTGQNFTERYRLSVLENSQQFFDSGPATVALTAVSLTTPERELDALKAIQRARFVEGQDITDLQTLVSILDLIKLNDAAEILKKPNTDFLHANHVRISKAQFLMHEFYARGVPTFIADSGAKRWMLHADEIYSNPQALIDQLNAS